MLSMEFVGIACGHVLAYFFVRTRIPLLSCLGLYQVYGRSCFCDHVLFFARIRSGGGGLSAASGTRLNQGSEVVNSFLVIICITDRGRSMHLCGIRAEIWVQGDKRCYDTEYHDTIAVLPNKLPCSVSFVTTSASRSMSLASKRYRRVCSVFQKERTIH